MPYIINDNPRRMVQVSMVGPVGAGSHSSYLDTVLVQTLLNLIPSSEAGPQAKLTVDGKCGPLTIAAIRRYQAARTRVVDGRVDPSGATITSLVQTLNNRNALPMGLPNLGPPSSDFYKALTVPPTGRMTSRADMQGRQPAMGMSKGFGAKLGQTTGGAQAKTAAPMTSKSNSTGWTFVTSSGLAVSADIIGVTVMNLVMAHDIEPGLTYQFSFAGAGVGLSAMPIGFDFSAEAMNSYGTDLIRNSIFAGSPPLFAPSFDLLPTVVITVGLNIGIGWSGAAVFWGGTPMASMYFSALTGMQAGIPGGSISMYVGAIAGFI